MADLEVLSRNCAADLGPTIWALGMVRVIIQNLPDPLDHVYSPRIDAMCDVMQDILKEMPALDEPADKLERAKALVSYLVQACARMRVVCATIDQEYIEYNVPLRHERDSVRACAHRALRYLEDQLKAIS